ncbi:MAG: choice-of-anchor D domain-containing protein [Terriglobales bacterium]
MRSWLWVICVGFVIGAGQKGAADPVQGPSSSPLELSPAKIDFGTWPAGARSQPRTATLTNQSNHSVSIRDIVASGIDFSETDTCQGTLAAGAHCTIDVTFAPAITGLRLGAVLVTTDSPGSLFLVLTGTGE